MQNFLLVSMFILFSQSVGWAQSREDLNSIEQAIKSFSGGGDRQNVEELDRVLHPQYRAVVHRAFGATDASLMDKPTYLQLIGDKKIGGDSREVHLLHLDVTNNIAMVKAVFVGKALKFTTYVSLVKMPDNNWLIVGDTPEIAKP